MQMSSGLALIAAALIVTGIVHVPDRGGQDATAIPFWQLQGTAPSAAETQALTDLRLAARADAPSAVLALYSPQ